MNIPAIQLPRGYISEQVEMLVSGVCNSVSNCAVLTVTTATTAVGPTNQTNCAGSTVTLITVACNSVAECSSKAITREA